MPKPQVLLRHPTPEDLKFVRHSWFESYRKGGLAPLVGFDVYAAGMNKLLDRLLHGDVHVAYATEVPDEIVGWVCRNELVTTRVPRHLHYVYVKQAYRRLGIATQLIEDVKCGPISNMYTHETRAGRGFAQKLALRFNPYLLFNP